MLFDTHCHVDYFEQPTQDVIIKDAFESGLAKFVTICTKVSQFDKILKIALKDERIFCTIGNHPENVDEEEPLNVKKCLEIYNSSYNSKKNITTNKIVAIGETGLDYYYKTDNKQRQIEEFLKHIELAKLLNLAVIVHCRDAWGDVFDIIDTSVKHGFRGDKFIIHCFTGGLNEVLKLNSLGCYISLSGIITFKNAQKIREGLLHINPQRIIVETDSPFLAPHPFRGQQNKPSYVKYVLDEVCKVFNKDISQQVYLNSLRAFEL
jgi:TatD DNase family protein